MAFGGFGLETYAKFLQDAPPEDLGIKDEWMEYPLFRELWFSNNPLFQVMLNNSTPVNRAAGTTYYLVVPPKEGMPGCLRLSEKSSKKSGISGRIGQHDVKGHVIIQQRPTINSGESMSDEARVEMIPGAAPSTVAVQDGNNNQQGDDASKESSSPATPPRRMTRQMFGNGQSSNDAAISTTDETERDLKEVDVQGNGGEEANKTVLQDGDGSNNDARRQSGRSSTTSPQGGQQQAEQQLHRSRSSTSVRVRGQSLIASPTTATTCGGGSSSAAPVAAPGWTLKVTRRGGAREESVPIQTTILSTEAIVSKDGSHVLYLLFVDQAFIFQPEATSEPSSALMMEGRTPGKREKGSVGPGLGGNASFTGQSPMSLVGGGVMGSGGHPWYKPLYQPHKVEAAGLTAAETNNQQLAVAVSGKPRSANSDGPAASSSLWIPDDAARFRVDISGLGSPHQLPSEKLDPIMGQLDAELQMFVSAYDCVQGFESFMIARVNQIAETAIEEFLDTLIAHKKASAVITSSAKMLQAQVDVMMAGGSAGANHTLGGSPSPTKSSRGFNNSFGAPPDVTGGGQEYDMDGSSTTCPSEDGTVIEDDVHEYAIVAFHTIVTNTIAPRLQPHWQEIHYNEDYAFYHACRTLSMNYSEEDCAKDAGLPLNFFGGGDGHGPGGELNVNPPLDLSEPFIIISQLANPLGVLSIMRILEAAIGSIVRVVCKRCPKTDVTADVCIPLTVFVLSRAMPQTLPSTLKFLWNFMLDAYETSSLCYALTTFEASMTQLLHEYTEYVRNR